MPFTYCRLFLLSACIFVAGCSQPPKETEIAGESQGTTFHIKFVPDPAKPLKIDEVRKQILTDLATIDLKLSNYRDDSEISKLNQAETTDWLIASKEIIDLLVISKTVYEKSQGCFDLTIKPLFDLWGFSKHEPKIPQPNDIEALKPHIGMSLLEIDAAQQRFRKKDPKLKIDLAGIAQGYSVGTIAKHLDSLGLHNYMVEIGGEMMVKGHKADGKAWRVGVESPNPLNRSLYKVIVLNKPDAKSVMTAGTYRNFFDENGKSYSHILNPKTGWPVTHQLRSVTVVHQDPSWADAWDTALLCMGETGAMAVAEQENLNVFLIYEVDGKFKEYESKSFVSSL
jgi:FAD:protein FMN transferase